MKKYFFPHLVILSTFMLIITLLSCSKDKIISNPGSNENSGITANTTSSQKVAGAGSVTGIILPVSAAVGIRIYSRYFSSDVYYYTKDGHFRFDRIPADIYTIEILNIKTSAVLEIPGVKVQGGVVTDIGRITLE